MRSIFLDYDTVSFDDDLDPTSLHRALPQLELRAHTAQADVAGALAGAEVVLSNKLRFTREVLAQAPGLRLIALAASAAGDVADAHYYMAEYHLLSGDLMMASDQLRLALGMPGLDPVQQARFRSRLQQIQEYMPKPEDRQSANRGKRP